MPNFPFPNSLILKKSFSFISLFGLFGSLDVTGIWEILPVKPHFALILATPCKLFLAVDYDFLGMLPLFEKLNLGLF